MIPAPFKCVGGKQRLVPCLYEYAPANFDVYCEPFVGGGALFRALADDGRFLAAQCVLSDASDSVYLPWRAIQDDAPSLAAALTSLFDEYEAGDDAARGKLYIQQRAWWNSERDRSASNAIFLRQTGYNGLWRENKRGHMNTPWGKYRRPTRPDVVRIASALPEHLRIRKRHYAEMLTYAVEGWWVYVDPPYVGQFSNYTAHGFDVNDHRMLLMACAAASSRGAYVMYSNAYSPDVSALLEELWPQARRVKLHNQQSVAARQAHRKSVEELLAYA